MPETATIAELQTAVLGAMVQIATGATGGAAGTPATFSTSTLPPASVAALKRLAALASNPKKLAESVGVQLTDSVYFDSKSARWCVVKEWDESKHKRGQPGNAGQFGPGGGGKQGGGGESKPKGGDDKPEKKPKGKGGKGKKKAPGPDVGPMADQIRAMQMREQAPSSESLAKLAGNLKKMNVFDLGHVKDELEVKPKGWPDVSRYADNLVAAAFGKEQQPAKPKKGKGDGAPAPELPHPGSGEVHASSAADNPTLKPEEIAEKAKAQKAENLKAANEVAQQMIATAKVAGLQPASASLSPVNLDKIENLDPKLVDVLRDIQAGKLTPSKMGDHDWLTLDHLEKMGNELGVGHEVTAAIDEWQSKDIDVAYTKAGKIIADVVQGKGSQAAQAASHKSASREALAKSPTKSSKIISNDNANETRLLTLEDGTQGVFKPVSGEGANIDGELRKGVKAGTYWRREVATSEIADLLGFGDLVPTTTVRQEGSDIGSIQAFADGATNAAKIYTKERYDGPVDAARAAAFDYLIGHIDRHANNWMMKDGKIVLIDNGLAMPTAYHESDFFNYRFWSNADAEQLPLAGIPFGKWGEIEAVCKKNGIEPKAVKLMQERYEALTSGAYENFSELPSLLPGSTDMHDMLANKW